jgi:hypothetical protein
MTGADMMIGRAAAIGRPDIVGGCMLGGERLSIAGRIMSDEQAMSDDNFDEEWPLQLIKAALLKLEAKGLIRRTGEYRNGEPVFVATELGKRLPPDAGFFQNQ